MNDAAFYIETKYDGERVQIHKDGETYRYFSRNGNEFTGSYGANVSRGSLTPYLHALFDPSVRNAIIDGEMVGWDTVAECMATKTGAVDVKHLVDGDEIQVAFVPFDVLLLNDVVMTTKPLKERLSQLKTIFRDYAHGRLIQPVSRMGGTLAELEKALLGAVEAREEGVIVKRPDSLYALSKRNAGWYKIKPDYVDQLSDDQDLVIVGGYFGQGRRANLMSHFLLAVAQTAPNGEKPSRWHTLCKVGSGYSAKELRELNSHLNQLPLVRSKGRDSVPAWLQTGSEIPDVFVHPNQSKILQIRSAEITPSSSYGVGWTLRFPRVERVRTDKDWHEALTLAEFQQLRLEREKAVGDKTLVGGGDGETSTRKRRAPAPRSAKPTLAASAKAADLSGVEATSMTLKGREICILTGEAGEWTKQKLEKAARQLGATVVQHPGKTTWCCIAGKETLAVKNQIKSGKYDILRSAWLRNAAEANVAGTWEPGDFLFARPETLAALSGDFDAYGDSYSADITPTKLRRLLDQEMETPKKRRSEDEAEVGEAMDSLRLFGGLKVWVGEDEEGSDEAGLALARNLLRVHGAKLSADPMESGLTHAVVPSRERKQRTEDKLPPGVNSVTYHWVVNCVEQNQLLSMDGVPN